MLIDQGPHGLEIRGVGILGQLVAKQRQRVVIAQGRVRDVERIRHHAHDGALADPVVDQVGKYVRIHHVALTKDQEGTVERKGGHTVVDHQLTGNPLRTVPACDNSLGHGGVVDARPVRQ